MVNEGTLVLAKTGGVTCFTNMYAVLDELPERLREKVTGRRARHDFDDA